FDFSSGVEYPGSNKISFNGSSYVYEAGGEFQPMGFSANDTVLSEVVVAGKIDDFETYRDLIEQQGAGKWLMIEAGKTRTNAMGSSHISYVELRSIALRSFDHGAAGIIFVSASDDGLDYPELSEAKRLVVPLPTIMISRKMAGEILQKEFTEVLAAAEAGKLIQTGVEFEAVTQVDISTSPSFNSTVSITGTDDSLVSQYVIIGAHHDHLGMGGPGTSSRAPDTIAVHYGADDNASGVAGVLELAEHIGSREPSRSFVFLTFGGEEMGLLGSKYFTKNPTIELDQVQAMINLDMIGRLNEDRQIQIGGIGTSPLFRSMIDTINKNYNFNLKYSEAGYGPSDHSSFYAKDIPVLYISTGANTDIHTPSDDITKINFEGMQELLYFVSDIAMELANMPEKIEFSLAGPKTGSNSRSRMGGITFGLMPDMTYDGDEGMPVTFVTEGKPAAAAGMKNGDIIKAVDGNKVGNVYDYMERLGQLKVGQPVVVKIDRDGESMELYLQL
ncbi:M28 family peptidase, partial [Bacteroidota bacterium]